MGDFQKSLSLARRKTTNHANVVTLSHLCLSIGRKTMCWTWILLIWMARVSSNSNLQQVRQVTQVAFASTTKAGSILILFPSQKNSNKLRNQTEKMSYSHLNLKRNRIEWIRSHLQKHSEYYPPFDDLIMPVLESSSPLEKPRTSVF